jgi:exodeoxyribonuclease V gamma subunit
LMITYTGQSLLDNSEISPSVIVSELLEVLKDCYQLDQLITLHPLHAFSHRYFDGKQAALYSYSQHDCAIAQSLAGNVADNKPWWQGRLESESEAIIEVEALFAFFRHPQRYFLNRQLGLRLPSVQQQAEEREIFQLDPLSNYMIQNAWVDNLLNGHDLSLDRLQAQGLWPPGAVGELVWQQQHGMVNEFVDAVKAKNIGASRPHVIDLQIGCYRVAGKLSRCYENGGLLYRFSNLKGRDFMEAWLLHLLVNQQTPQSTFLLAKNAEFEFTHNMASTTVLTQLLNVFQQGQKSPYAFFTEAAFYYIQQKKPETALAAVIKFMQEQVDNGYEPEIAYLLTNHALPEIFNQGFADSCQELLSPAWGCQQ